MSVACDPTDRVERARRVLVENPVWYQTLELAPGVITPGFVDHRPITARVLPADLRGRRALDVGTYDGHWAFALEERGARVTALDLPDFEATSWPPIHRERLLREADERDMELGRGFRLAKELRGSRVERVAADVQSLGDGDAPGPYDVIFVGAILLHLRDPVGALERLRERLEPGGRLIALEAFSRGASLLAPRKPMATFETIDTAFNWWVPNLATLRAWLHTAGFTDVKRHAFLRPPSKAEMRQTYVHMTARVP